jgi:hypothetical protein
MKTNCCDCCHPAIVDQDACGCCEGIEIVTPLSTYNRPGLSEISYRIGTHAGFLEVMTARLTGYYLEKQDAEGKIQKYYPLKGLTTRDAGDPALALLDAWATVADVLTFYQERIANEGYLRTATERRSIVELARLVGYKPRPGVAASVFLAYNIDAKASGEVVIPAGSRSQSIPGPDELPQSFETSDDLKATSQWNNLKPRMTQAQTKSTIEGTTETDSRIYLKGINTNLRANDALLIDFGDDHPKHGIFKHVKDVLPDNENDRTLVTLETFKEPSPPPPFETVSVVNIIHQLVLPASIQPANQFQLRQSLAGQFALRNNAFSQNTGSGFGGTAENSVRPTAQAGYSVLSAFSPILKDHLATATASVKLTDNKIRVYQLGIKAALFGHNLPLPVEGECFTNGGVIFLSAAAVSNPDNNLRILALDAEYQNIKIGARVAIIVKTNQTRLKVANVTAVDTLTLGGPQTGDFNDLGFFSTCPTITYITVADQPTVTTVSEPIKIKVTVLTLDIKWRHSGDKPEEIIKNTTVYIQNGNPELAEEPITEPVCGGKDETIELDGFYSDLEAGRWVIVSGERHEVAGVRFSELALLASVTHSRENLPDENLHTYIQLAEKLAYCFKRETVTIYGNVVKATHGESRLEILGSGDGAKALQTFALKQKPLTQVSAANPSGIASTLKLFVNNIEWHEVDSLAGLEANDRLFISQTDNEDNTSVTFGNGKQGARLPTGIENIRAEYRNGIGRAGNVKEQQISLLLTKPQGVNEVINPLRASGGADKETRDQARQHIPLAVKALDRLVSTQDYEDFSRIFAGIGKAFAVELSDGRLPLIHVTIAGAGDIPIDENSDLFRNLRQALYDFGDPFQKIQLAVRELLMIVIEAKVAILPDYQWESVVPEVRSALLEHFSFERRELGQDVMLSEVISVMQSVQGVAYVDVDAFGGIPEKISEKDGSRRFLTPDEISEAVDCISTRWSVEDMEAKCAGQETHQECEKYNNCKKYGNFNNAVDVRQRLQVNVADFEQGVIRPAQLAFLSPDVPATLILNQIERLP